MNCVLDANSIVDCAILATMENTLSVWLNEQIRERGWSIREVSRRAGLSHTAINNALDGQGVRLDTYRGLSRAFGMPLEDVLRAAGELPPLPPEIDEEAEMLRIIRGLSCVKFQAALLMLRSLAAYQIPADAARRITTQDYTTPRTPVTRESLVARLNRLWDVATEEQLQQVLVRLLQRAGTSGEGESRGDGEESD